MSSNDEVERRALTENEGTLFRSSTHSLLAEAARSLQPIVMRSHNQLMQRAE